MPQVLTTKAIIKCPHGGMGTSAPLTPLWVVQGGVVLQEGDSGVLSCPFVPLPCVGYRLRSMGLNAMQVGGRRVMLATDFNQTFTGLPLDITENHATIDNSTPAPIPLGQAAPPLAPALADTAKPVVTVAPGALAFNKTTMQPATAAATYTLNTPFPLRWLLALISEPTGTNQDVTNGLPGGLMVAPADGAWGSPSLSVTLTLTAAFMGGLAPGRHHFYLTGVSQRGLSSYAEMILTVS